MFETDPKWLELARLAWRRGKAVLVPRPRFHPSSPEISRPDEADWQWFHIPVSVQNRWLRRDIPCCEAFVKFVGGPLSGKRFRLRWRSDAPAGSSEITLLFGIRRMLPLAARRDKSPAALLTDNDFLMKSSGGYGLAGVTGKNVIMAVTHSPQQNHGAPDTDLLPGLHKARIKIVSGDQEWSSEIYKISVPNKGASNSHFSVTSD